MERNINERGKFGGNNEEHFLMEQHNHYDYDNDQKLVLEQLPEDSKRDLESPPGFEKRDLSNSYHRERDSQGDFVNNDMTGSYRGSPLFTSNGDQHRKYSPNNLSRNLDPDQVNKNQYKNENYEEKYSTSSQPDSSKVHTLVDNSLGKNFGRNKINEFSCRDDDYATTIQDSADTKMNSSGNGNYRKSSQEQTMEESSDNFVHPPLKSPLDGLKAAPKRKYSRSRYSNEELQIALSKCREGLSIRECSKKYGIPKSTLWDKLSCRTPATVLRPGRSFKVSNAVENRLVNWILKMNEDGFKVQEKQIIEAVKLFHDKSEGTSSPTNSSHSKPGKAWYKNFLKRYPAALHNQSVNYKKAEYTIDMLQAWYDETVDTEVPVLVETVESMQPRQPEPTTSNQIKSVIDHIEQTIGDEKLNFYRQWKENGELSKKDPLYTAWYALATDLDRQCCSSKNKRKRKAEQPRVNGNYIHHQHQQHPLEDSSMEFNSEENNLIDLNSTTTTRLEFTSPRAEKDSRTVENELQSHDNELYLDEGGSDITSISQHPVDSEHGHNNMGFDDHTNLTKPHPRKTMMLSYNSR